MPEKKDAAQAVLETLVRQGEAHAQSLWAVNEAACADRGGEAEGSGDGPPR